MTHTENFNLNQWQKSDRLMMSDFNADNAKLDAALATLAAGQLRMAVGTYTGNGAAENTIALGFKPKFMLVTQAQPGERSSDCNYLWLLGERTKLQRSGTSSSAMVGPYTSGETEYFLARRTDAGVTFVRLASWEGYYNMNEADKQYAYVAIG